MPRLAKSSLGSRGGELLRGFAAGGLYAVGTFFVSVAALQGADLLAAKTLPALSRSIFVDHVPQFMSRKMARLYRSEDFQRREHAVVAKLELDPENAGTAR